MSAVAPPLPEETTGLSEPQRILNTFFAPSKTFEDIRRNASWWVPYLLISVMAVLFWVTVGNKVGWDNLARSYVSSSSSFEQLSKADQEKQIHTIALGSKYGGYVSPIFLLLFYGLVPAGVLLVVFNFVLEAEISFGRTMAIWFYGTLPNMLALILTIVALLVGDPENFNMQNPLAANMAYFLDRNSSKFLYTLATGLDVFSVWVVILVGMGFAINSKGMIQPLPPQQAKFPPGLPLATMQKEQGVGSKAIEAVPADGGEYRPDPFAKSATEPSSRARAAARRQKVETSTAITTVAIIYLIYKLGQAGFAALRG